MKSYPYQGNLDSRGTTLREMRRAAQRTLLAGLMGVALLLSPSQRLYAQLATGLNGLRMTGGADGDQFGQSVSSAGDVNNDGFDDVIIGALYGDGQTTNSGTATVVFGHTAPFDPLAVSAVNGTNGFALLGAGPVDYTGFSVSKAGDVNADGIDDVIVGAPADSNGSPSQAYVVFGKADWTSSATVNLADLNGSDGFKIFGGVPFFNLGDSVSKAGDVNGDGMDDVLVGCSRADTDGDINNDGAAVVLFGKADWSSSATVDLSVKPNGTNGFLIAGSYEQGTPIGLVAGAGDMNNDGHNDIIVGERNPSFSVAGRCWVVFGKDDFTTTPAIFVHELNAADGFAIEAATIGDKTGTIIAAAGDMNADGYDDVIIGTPYLTVSGSQRGGAYVVLGQSDFPTTVSLADANGTDAFAIRGDFDEKVGFSAAGAGDLNNDGFSDVILNTYFTGTRIYVVFGKATFSAIMNTNEINGISNGLVYYHEWYSLNTPFVSGAGDFNGDGADDVIVGAPNGEAGTAIVDLSPSPMLQTIGGKVNLNFAKSRDSARLTGILDLTDNIVLDGLPFTFAVGSYVYQDQLDSKGKSYAFSVKTTAKKGSPPQTVFTISLKNAGLIGVLDDYGLVNSDVTGVSVAVPVRIIIDTQDVTGNVLMTYTAKTGKTGKAK